jgi:glycogen operon protein
MHVDGFRFDLASTLAREQHEVSKLSAFFDIIHQDPVLSQVKLIAEPWDVGEGGYQVGHFPVLWSEWNGKYRDAVRSYWKGDHGHLREMACRLVGSPDLYHTGGRKPDASINFITAHDGFTLADLVGYNEKHNQANGEENRDGDNHNRSWNCGVEGPTEDAEVNSLRRRQQRNFLATLFLSQGVPMLCAGDEWGRTQHGNNNAYCQDNEISWLNWEGSREAGRLFDFTRKLIRFRQEHPVFHRPKFLRSHHIHGRKARDVTWFNPAGDEMHGEAWNSYFERCLGMLLSGEVPETIHAVEGMRRDETFLLLFNAHYEPVDFVLPDGPGWERIFSTETEEGFLETPEGYPAKSTVRLLGRSLSMFMKKPSGG